MTKQLILFLVACSTSTASVFAQAAPDENDPNAVPKITPEQIRAVESINSPEKLAAWLRNKHQVSLSSQWPSNFPVQVYPSNVLYKNFGNSTKGQPTAGANLVTKDQPAQVFDFYKSALSRANWKLQIPTAKARAELKLNNDFYFLNATQDRQSISLRCMKHPQSGGTMLSISWRKN